MMLPQPIQPIHMQIMPMLNPMHHIPVTPIDIVNRDLAKPLYNPKPIDYTITSKDTMGHNIMDGIYKRNSLGEADRSPFGKSSSADTIGQSSDIYSAVVPKKNLTYGFDSSSFNFAPKSDIIIPTYKLNLNPPLKKKDPLDFII